MGGIKTIGELKNNQKKDIANKLKDGLDKERPLLEGEMYLGYPVYINDFTKTTTRVDIALITKQGVFIINVLETDVVDYGLIQDDIYSKVEAKLKKDINLVKKRNLVFKMTPITYYDGDLEEQEDYCLVRNHSELLKAILSKLESESYTDVIYERIIAGLQEAFKFNYREKRKDVSEGTKASAIEKMSELIERYGECQMEAILSGTEGIQRIRGMAGSGKTIVLARKAVELHTAHPEWKIVVTFSTRALKEQFEKLISYFYSTKNDGANYDPKQLRIMHSWGSHTATGVYYEICLSRHLSPLSLDDARRMFGRKGDLFSKICGHVLKEVEDFEPMYDCIIIDEAQDYDKNFLLLCSKVLDKHQRLVYAYDELQSLNEIQMPTPEDVFGRAIDNDTPLKVCYRNQSAVIVTAHAIGMGLYSRDGIIQLPSREEVWETIGYKANGLIHPGKSVTLYRTEETSPDFLKIEKDESICFFAYKDYDEMMKALFEEIQRDLREEQMLPKDMMIIDMDTFNHVQNYNRAQERLCRREMESENTGEPPLDYRMHIAGAASPEDFFREDSIVYTGVRRAKGNESYMVYIINAHKCINSLQKRADRNALFTAITRSKGWVRVLGYGKDMELLCEEFDRIKDSGYKLVFDQYPTEDEKKRIHLNNTDVTDNDARMINRTKDLFDRLSEGGRISKAQLLKQLLGTNKEELQQLLTELKSEQE